MPAHDTRLTACHGGCGKQVSYKTKARVCCPECRAAGKRRVRADYYRRNKDKELAASREWQAANKPRSLQIAKEWKSANREKVRAYKREVLKRPAEVLNNRMRAGINQRLRDGKGGRSWRALLGYGPEELMAHLERQFLPGMTWENVGKWHIDHIVPLSSFEYGSADSPEFRRAWALTNLRPLWGNDNRAKWAKRTYLI